MGQQDLSIKELVGKIKRGEIRLPEMQRQYVWRATRVRDLLDSLYREYPSGTILTWETDVPVPIRDFSVAQETYNRYQLLLDGQQRLTSLSAILRGEPILVRGRKRPIDILFNLDHPDQLEVVTDVSEDDEADQDEVGDVVEDDMADASEDDFERLLDKLTFVVATSKFERMPNWVSVTEVFKENSDTKFLKKAGVLDFNDPRYEKYTSRLKRLRAIENYNYRVHILERDKSYEEVTEIFVRVNSLGAKLKGSDLALAQITATWRDSLRVFQEFEKECSELGFDFDMGLLIKNLIVFTTGQSRFKTVSSLTKEQLMEGWDVSKKGIKFAINFLRSNVGIDSPALLASPFLVIALAYYAHSKNYHFTAEAAHQIRYWILVANAKARYSRGSSETFLDQDLASIRNVGTIEALLSLLKTQVGRLEIVPEDLENRNIRSSYFKSMFLAFRSNGAKDWRDQLVISLKHSGNQHMLQFHHIFPQDLLKKAGKNKQQINDISNLAFISGRTNQKISNKEPQNYLNDVVANAGNNSLTDQCIPTDRELWDLNSYEAFLTNRRQKIADRLNEFFNENVALSEPDKMRNLA